MTKKIFNLMVTSTVILTTPTFAMTEEDSPSLQR